MAAAVAAEADAATGTAAAAAADCRKQQLERRRLERWPSPEKAPVAFEGPDDSWLRSNAGEQQALAEQEGM